MDKIFINGIKLTTIIGANSWEKQFPQVLHCDIGFQTDVKRIATNDDLNQAIDYDKVLLHVFNFIKNNHFSLIESLAEHIAQELLTHFSTQWVQITLRKPGALTHAKEVAITIERSSS